MSEMAGSSEDHTDEGGDTNICRILLLLLGWQALRADKFRLINVMNLTISRKDKECFFFIFISLKP